MPDDPTTLASRTIQSHVRDDNVRTSLVLWLATAQEVMPPWWSKRRDLELRKFWRMVDPLAGAVYALEAKLATIPFHVEPKDYTVRAHQAQGEKFEYMLQSASEWGRGWEAFFGKWIQDLLCLAGPTKISLGGERLGKTKSIAQIVRDRDVGPFLSVDRSGHLTEKVATGWHETPLGPRKWWWLSVANGRHSKGEAGGIFATNDHPFLTRKGWIQADAIAVGDEIALADPSPSDAQSQLLTGMLLGDGCIGWSRNRAMLRLTHGVDQEKWLSLKQASLAGFQWTGYNVHGRTIGVNSRVSSGLNAWRQAWYPAGRKIVSREYVERHFSPMMLAAWYCDDGSMAKNKTRAGNPTSPHAMLYTQGFTHTEVEWLAGFLCGKGIAVTARTHKVKGRVYPVLHVTCAGFRALVETIGAYVPPCLRYKLPQDAPAYDPELWKLEPATVSYAKVTDSRAREYSSGNKVVETTYHLGIKDTRCFLAAGFVSHNTQDNGCFGEIIGDGPPDGPILGMPYGVCSLDSARCDRTSNPEFPVVYTALDGKRYKLHYTRVAFASLQASPIAEMHDVGLCAVSKCLNISQNVLDVLIYNQEKLGSRPSRSLMVTSGGLGPEDVRLAFAMANEAQDNAMLTRYSKTIVIGDTALPEAKLEMLDLASLPDGFDYETSMSMGMAAIALAFGVDARELWPMTGTGSTRADALIQHIKAQTKGIGHLLAISEQALFKKMLPDTLIAYFDYTDDAQDRQIAEIKKIRSERHQLDLTQMEVVTERTVREQMLWDEDLTQAQFEQLELESYRMEDGSPILQVFYDPEYRSILRLALPDPLDKEANTADTVKAEIGSVRKDIIRQMGAEKNPAMRSQLNTAYFALDALEEYYEGEKKPPPKPPLFPFQKPKPDDEDLEVDEVIPDLNSEEALTDADLDQTLDSEDD